MFAGVGARTADLDALALAQMLDEAGEPAPLIWDLTGWFHGPGDGLWRHEIDDSRGRVTDELVEHPALLAAYPQLGDTIIDTELAPVRYGRWWPGTPPRIVARGPDQDTVWVALLHELQHVIQAIEGFEPGRLLDDFSHAPDPRGLYQRTAGEVEARATQARAAMSAGRCSRSSTPHPSI